MVLVAGLHRLEAAKVLGWTEIHVIEVEMDDVDRELWEIDENLIRADLTPTEEGEHLKRRKELWEMREVRVGQLGSSGDRDERGRFTPEQEQPEGFASEASDVVGKSKRTVNRAIERAKKVAPEVRDAIRGTELDTGVNLDELAKMEPAEQQKAVKTAKARGSRTVTPEAPKGDGGYRSIMYAYAHAGPGAREQFHVWLVTVKQVDFSKYSELA